MSNWRHPTKTSLTRESLDALIGDARAAGMRLNTWIDIQQLGQLNRETGKIAYRSLQEGLTTRAAMRRDPRYRWNSPPIPPQACTRMCPIQLIRPFRQHRRMPRVPPWIPKNAFRTGAGLPGLAERVRQAGEHVDSVLTHDTRSMLMCSYHGLSEQRREQR